MALLKFTLFILYNYYSGGRWEKIPEVHAAATLSLAIWMNIAAAFCFAGKGKLIFNDGLTSIFILLVLIAVLAIIAGKSKLDELQYEESSVNRGGWLVFFYLVISLAALILGAYFMNRQEATLIKPLR